jgi:PAS domain S-box-containing protein
MAINRHKEETAALKNCTNLFQSIFEQVIEPVIVWTETGHILVANRSASSFSGYSHDELAQMQISHLEDKDRLQATSERVRILLKSGHSTYETLLQHRDGSISRVLVNTSRIDWDNQTAFSSIYHPLTEPKQDKVLLGESEARFRAITDSTKDAIIMMDEKGLVSLWNPAAERIFGYTAPEVLGENLHSLLAPARYHEAQNIGFREFQKTGQGKAIDSTLELEACHRDGHEISIELSLSKLYVLGVYHTIGIVRDITERKKAEQQLKESEERFRALHNASFGGICIHYHGVISDCNHGLSEMSGYSRDELIGMDGLQLIAPDSRSTVRDNVQSCYGAAYEVEGIRKDGTIYPLSIRGCSIPYKDHTVRVTEFRDITERKQAEDHRKQLEEQLMQAQKMEAIGTLAGGVAHDFNNILSAILGNVDLARNLTPPGSPAADLLDKALKAIRRATSLVSQILAFSRQGDARRLPVRLAPVMREAIKLLRPLLPSTIKIIQQIDEDSLPILADPTQIHQIMMNLCTNAFHVMELTGGTLTISLKNTDYTSMDLQQHPEVKPGHFVKLTIEDTGPGIAPEVRGKIFNPYFTTKMVGKGTGMGLAIVHGIVQSYGGFITFDSELGRGTSFYINLPAVEQVAAVAKVDDQLIIGGTERILLVDDEEIVADMGRSILEHLGYKVTVYTNSIEAFSVFKKTPSLFDIVITDQTMPAMTGFDLAQRILAIRQDIPIIICTGYSRTISEEKAKAMGVKGFAMKPLAIKDISLLIRKVLDA